MVVKGYEEYLLMKRSVEELVLRYEALQKEADNLMTELTATKSELENRNEELKELRGRYERARFSGAILGNSEDAEIAKRRVNELVREIDKCIALLDR